ncbi:MAG: hypothetical protein L0271_24455, partial [Gemmatimonadetes bacterium]|nr:hypothetical protein [Gemmatimonadota bacterium]
MVAIDAHAHVGDALAVRRDTRVSDELPFEQRFRLEHAGLGRNGERHRGECAGKQEFDRQARSPAGCPALLDASILSRRPSPDNLPSPSLPTFCAHLPRQPSLSPRYHPRMPDVVFLGPQFQEPNLAAALRHLAIDGALVSISAGWQEREGEIDELCAHVGLPVTDLGLYGRAEAVLAADAELASAYRQRQTVLRELQDLYRLRLTHAKDAARELLSRDCDPQLVRSAQRAALRALRALDREHLRAIEREHANFRRRVRPQQRASVVPHIRELRDLIEPASAVLVAGGHVAVLANRLRLFDLQRLLAGKTLIAWSAGAMALSDCIVLFHD